MMALPAFSIIGHRGFARRYPENTLAAFEAAVQSGAHMLELDTALSRDRKAVVIHDDTLDRTTDGTGRVADTDWDTIRKLDAGAWFSDRFAGERVPALDQVVHHFAGRIVLNVEIKGSSYEAEARPDGIEHQVAGLIQARRIHDRIMVSSFEPGVLERIRSLDDRICLGLLTETYPSQEVLRWVDGLRLFAWNPHAGAVTPDRVAEFHRKNVRVFPYTVNSVSRARSLMDIGVDGLFTDDPLQMVQDLL